MAQKIIVSDFKTGFETDLAPFNISNDAFPLLEDFYLWRGRVRRKRGDQLLGRLQRDLEDESIGNTGASPWTFNIYTLLSISGEGDAQIIPGTVEITIAGPIVFTDQGDGTLTSVTPGNSGTIVYSTGAVTLTHTAGAGAATTITFSYYPCLPVMGLEDFDVGNSHQPILVSFDTKYSYGFNQGTNTFYDTTFYKATQLPFTWSGQNYQQFWTSNWEGVPSIENSATSTGCLWAINGKAGFHFVNCTYIAGSGTAVITIGLTSGGAPYQDLIVNDILWFNEWAGVGVTINGLSGTCTAIVNAALGQYTITFSGVQTVNGTGIAQLMTNSISGQDGIRWYDGDPTTVGPPNNNGWVNFAPPLSAYDATNNPNPLYLVGAQVSIPYKGRLLFGDVWLQTSNVAAAQRYQNRVVYSQVGIPFYSNPLPVDITGAPGTAAQVEAWYQNQAGRGGFITAPITDAIVTWGENEDILITLFDSQPLKMIYTSDDSLPFIFQTISAELGGIGTFSGVKLDTGILSMGSYGLSMTTATSVQRIDLQIPDQIFSVGQSSNKTGRITAARDFRNEWVYFTFCPSQNNTITFPTKTLLYNYRENNWSVFRDQFTTYGTFRRTTNITWASLGAVYGTWQGWNVPWNWPGDDAFYPAVIGGNHQGFVMTRGDRLGQEPALFIQDINTTSLLVTSPDHGLLNGDYIYIESALGVTGLNNLIWLVHKESEDTFTISRYQANVTGTYLGAGVFKRQSRPDLMTKQFPSSWGAARQTRIGPTLFLFQTNSYPTEEGEGFPQVTANLYAGQNTSDISNQPNVEPYLSYTNVILTCPETNTGYTTGEFATWHRLSTSITGGTVQVGITLSDEQMQDPTINEAEITLLAIVIEVSPSGVLA